MSPSVIRHNLHCHPGISGAESYAHDLVVRELAALSPDRLFDHVGGYGVVAVWGADPSVPTVAFRADTDALPIGHRCGHDGHTAILLRLAERVAAARPADKNVMLVFQPEEEVGTGAQKMLDAGILQQYNIRAIYGLHNLPGYPLGTVVLNRNTFAAASAGVAYRFVGRNTHASTPEKGLNPGLAVAELIQAMSALNSGEAVANDQFRQSTLICVRLGEEAFGTSAGEAEVMFTLRAFTNRAMEQLMTEADTIAQTAAVRHGLAFERVLRDPFAATENLPALVEQIERRCSCNYIYMDKPFRWSEDFGSYLKLFPGAFFGIGAGEEQPELHHPDYDFPDALTEPAAEVFYRLLDN